MIIINLDDKLVNTVHLRESTEYVAGWSSEAQEDGEVAFGGASNVRAGIEERNIRAWLYEEGAPQRRRYKSDIPPLSADTQYPGPPEIFSRILAEIP